MRKTLPALYLLLGLFVGLTAASAMAQKVTYLRTASPAGYAEVGPGAADASSPFVPEDAAAGSRPMSLPGQAHMPGLAVASPCDSQDCGCGEDCSSGGCGDGCRCMADCDACPNFGSVFFAGMESFRGIVNQDFQNSNGVVAGGNLGVPIPMLRDYGFGAQLGASFGGYGFDGRSTNGTGTVDSLGNSTGSSDVQQQIFVTAGIFRRATEKMPLNMGFAYDWMINDGYGVFATSPRLGQFRSQCGYAFNACNEIGVWSTLNDRGDAKSAIAVNGSGVTVTYRPLSQANFFWHHNYDSGADSWLWMGVTETERLSGDGSLGGYTVGLSVQVPMSNYVALYGSGQYMRPTANAGPVASIDNAYSVGFGLQFYPRGNAKNRTVAGNCWMPVMPVANNGSFLVDSNITTTP